MSEGTSKHSIPRRIEPRKFAQQGIRLRGKVPVAELTRLREAGVLVDEVEGDLEFSLDEQRERVVRGFIRLRAMLPCQRCLELMPLDLRCDVHVAMVRDEEASRDLPSSYDPWVVADEEADVYDLIEEEILLNLPYVAYHDYACVSLGVESLEKAVDVQPDKKNPFQVLASLKDKTK
jgi:uncharacterized protein